ncbi:MAG: RelA/SpoT domain-containing protein [Burkholderiaceae bacterium]
MSFNFGVSIARIRFDTAHLRTTVQAELARVEKLIASTNRGTSGLFAGIAVAAATWQIEQAIRDWRDWKTVAEATGLSIEGPIRGNGVSELGTLDKEVLGDNRQICRVPRSSMTNYALPTHSASEVNAAAREIVRADNAGLPFDADALRILNTWRAAHQYPLNGIHMTLRNRVASMSAGSGVTAQRIKRLESILLKLHDRPSMKMSQMQDVGGCRAIVPSIRDVRKLVERYHRSPVVHEMLRGKDYIEEPAEDTGYRSVHLRFRFASRAEPSLLWNGLKVEMQIRSRLQHQWATAVEVAGTLTQQALKSRRGNPEWLRLFKLISACFALRERTTPVPGTSDSLDELRREIAELNQEHRLVSVLSQYAGVATRISRRRDAEYYVLILDPDRGTTEIMEFAKSELTEATMAVSRLEERIELPSQVLLVAAASIRSLRRAYPNYFMDTRGFVRQVGNIFVSGPARARRRAQS